MQLLAKLTKMLNNETGVLRRFSRPTPRNVLDDLVNDLRRELYGMDGHEEAVVRQILSNTGQRVTICRNTVGFGKKGKPCYLEEGNQVKIAKLPFQIDPDRGVQVVVIDQNNRYLHIRLSDYMRDICVKH